MVCRNRTPSEHIGYGLYPLFFRVVIEKGTRKTVLFCQAEPCLNMELDSKKYHPHKMSAKRKKIFGYAVDETPIKVGSERIWLRAAIEPKYRQILALDISRERNMLLLKGLSRVWSRLMEGARYRLMAERGIHKPAGS